MTDFRSLARSTMATFDFLSTGDQSSVVNAVSKAFSDGCNEGYRKALLAIKLAETPNAGW